MCDREGLVADAEKQCGGREQARRSRTAGWGGQQERRAGSTGNGPGGSGAEVNEYSRRPQCGSAVPRVMSQSQSARNLQN